MIKVSVIVPVYKVPLKYLRECFASLLAQTMQECEFIVVSDGAPDAECSVCEEYADKDSRFNFFRREHAGVSATRNYGIKQAQGEYITFVDADDWIDPENLDLAYNHAKNNQSDIVFWDLVFHKDISNSTTSCFINDIPLLNSIEVNEYKKNIVHPNTQTSIPAYTVCKLTKRSLITENEILFNQNLIIGEDRVFNYNIVKVSKRISYIHKEFYHYRILNSSTINRFQKYLFDQYMAYIVELNAISENHLKKQLSNETVSSFYNCIQRVHLSNISPKEKINEFKHLKDYINTNNFNHLISNADYDMPKPAIGVEIRLMKKKFSLLFDLRILKFKLSTFFHSLF